MKSFITLRAVPLAGWMCAMLAMAAGAQAPVVKLGDEYLFKALRR
jgi:hypothetical protein